MSAIWFLRFILATCVCMSRINITSPTSKIFIAQAERWFSIGNSKMVQFDNKTQLIPLSKEKNSMLIATKEKVYNINETGIQRVIYWYRDRNLNCSNDSPLLCINQVQTAVKVDDDDYIFCGIKNMKKICENWILINDEFEYNGQDTRIDADRLVSAKSIVPTQPSLFNGTLCSISGNRLFCKLLNDRDNGYQELDESIFANRNISTKRIFPYDMNVFYFFNIYYKNKNKDVSYVAIHCKNDEGFTINHKKMLTTFIPVGLRVVSYDTNGKKITFKKIDYITKPYKYDHNSMEEEFVIAAFSSDETDKSESVLIFIELKQLEKEIKLFRNKIPGCLDNNSTLHMVYMSNLAHIRDLLDNEIIDLKSVYEITGDKITSIDIFEKNKENLIISLGLQSGYLKRITYNKIYKKITHVDNFIIPSNMLPIIELKINNNKATILTINTKYSFDLNNCTIFKTSEDCNEISGCYWEKNECIYQYAIENATTTTTSATFIISIACNIITTVIIIVLVVTRRFMPCNEYNITKNNKNKYSELDQKDAANAKTVSDNLNLTNIPDKFQEDELKFSIQETKLSLEVEENIQLALPKDTKTQEQNTEAK